MISSAMPVGAGYDAQWEEDRTVLTKLVSQLLIPARAAQVRWAVVTIQKRLAFLRPLRDLLADRAQSLCEMEARLQNRPQSEILTSEIFPLIAACKFLEREAVELLGPRRLGKTGLPLWLHGLSAEVHRDPFGIVLVIGPVNYSLSLPGVQILQAIVCGNAVLLKPGPGGTHSARAFLKLLGVAGLPDGLVTLLPETVEMSNAALSAGVDKVVFTGSAKVGRQILADLAPQLVPATMELSGCDALLVREDGDLNLVAKSLHFGLTLNSGETCIAPHRLLVAESRADQLEDLLYQYFRSQPQRQLTTPVGDRLLPVLKEALARGARFLSGAVEPDGRIIVPAIITGVSPDCRLLHDDFFAPVAAMLRVKDDEEAVRRINDCPYALGASIFSANESIARALGARLRVGFVTINDLIVPAGDPRIPIGGRGRSGFGSTRGREGLLDLTVPKVVTIRRGRFRPHLSVTTEEELHLLYAYLKFVNARDARSRWFALKLLGRRLIAQRSIRRNP
jgi:acyl-CoA reductase-like NAD-dependent aldehyde dehydrogenase